MWQNTTKAQSLRLYFLKVYGMLKTLIFALCCVFIQHSYAADATGNLLQTLHMPQPVYEMRDEDYRLDSKMLKSSHAVGWVRVPLVDVSAQEYRGYKQPIEVAMTVIAATGRIAEVKILKTSGSKPVDEKVKLALLDASLEKIPYADANANYVLEHRFSIEKPL